MYYLVYFYGCKRLLRESYYTASAPTNRGATGTSADCAPYCTVKAATEAGSNAASNVSNWVLSENDRQWLGCGSQHNSFGGGGCERGACSDSQRHASYYGHSANRCDDTFSSSSHWTPSFA